MVIIIPCQFDPGLEHCRAESPKRLARLIRPIALGTCPTDHFWAAAVNDKAGPFLMGIAASTANLHLHNILLDIKEETTSLPAVSTGRSISDKNGTIAAPDRLIRTGLSALNSGALYARPE
jgi:hypothetical protein